MGSQFVDLNADGHLDYLAATYDGSPHVAWGSASGFGKPEHVKDAKGQRLLITGYWDDEKSAHLTTDRAFDGGAPKDERCVSAWAHDMDGDGDLDMLLGSYENGRLYVQRNEGTKEKAAFTGKNVAVMAGDVPFALPGKLTAPRMLDWDGDGDLDLLAGSFGDSYGEQVGGGVHLCRNVGKDGKTAFGPLETLINPSPKGGSEPTRPDGGLYVDATDWDGDGDLDLVVGGYSMWKPPARTLTAEEKAEADRLAKRRDELQKVVQEASNVYSKAYEKAVEGRTPNDPEAKKAIKEASDAYMKATTAERRELAAVTKALDPLVPGLKRDSFVWLYERITRTASR